MKTKHALFGLTLGLRAQAAQTTSTSHTRHWRSRLLLLLALCLTRLAFAPAAWAQAAPPSALNSSSFSLSDFLNPPGLVQKLRAQSDPVSAFVWSQFPAAVQGTLADTASPLPVQLLALVEGLNSVLQGNVLYDQQRFEGVALSPETHILLVQLPTQGENLVRFNRLLLEDAYRLELRKSPPSSLNPPTGTAVSTDQADYAPGATAHIRGREFQAGETVKLQVLHADGTPSSGQDHQPWLVIAGADGAFQTTWHVCEDDCLGSSLKLTAFGQASGRSAQALFTDAAGAPTYEQLRSFGEPSLGGWPRGGLIQGIDGALYGTALQGGSSDWGTVFKLNLDGTGFSVLVNFDSTTGTYPRGRLHQGADGNLYGTTANGGTANAGTVFRLVFESPNTPPVSVSFSVSLPEDTAIAITLAGSDSDGDTLSYSVLAGPANGVLNGTAPNLIYTPAPNFAGADSFTYKVNDGTADSNVATVTINVTPVNDAPVAALAIPDQASAYGNPFSFSFAAGTFTDVDVGQTLSYTASGLPPGITFNSASRTFSGVPAQAGGFAVVVMAADNGVPSLSASANFTITIAPRAIGVAANPGQTKIYGTPDPAAFSYTITSGSLVGSDTLNGALTRVAGENVGAYAIQQGTLTAGVNYTLTFVGADFTITPAALEVTIQSPESGFLQTISTAIDFTGSFTPTGNSGPYSAHWTVSSATVAETIIPATVNGLNVSAQIQFPTPGIYLIALSVEDAAGLVGEADLVRNDSPSYIVIYDPNGSFVTGGGWINSPAGAFHPSLQEFAGVTGKASFGFVAKYLKGAQAPTGNTEFQFRAGNLNFKSTAYQWLTVAGARAQYKGWGTINGVAD